MFNLNADMQESREALTQIISPTASPAHDDFSTMFEKYEESPVTHKNAGSKRQKINESSELVCEEKLVSPKSDVDGLFDNLLNTRPVLANLRS